MRTTGKRAPRAGLAAVRHGSAWLQSKRTCVRAFARSPPRSPRQPGATRARACTPISNGMARARGAGSCRGRRRSPRRRRSRERSRRSPGWPARAALAAPPGTHPAWVRHPWPAHPAPRTARSRPRAALPLVRPPARTARALRRSQLRRRRARCGRANRRSIAPAWHALPHLAAVCALLEQHDLRHHHLWCGGRAGAEAAGALGRLPVSRDRADRGGRGRGAEGATRGRAAWREGGGARVPYRLPVGPHHDAGHRARAAGCASQLNQTFFLVCWSHKW